MPGPDPVEIAIRKIAETRNILCLLITSSETFDYPTAKAALMELQTKIGELGRVQCELQRQLVRLDERIVPFGG
jgi:hypothetical protein